MKQTLSEKNNLNLGFYVMLFGTVIILLWVGLFKFTDKEANAIKDLVSNHMLTFWMYDVFSVQVVSNIVGTFEIVIAILILAGLKDKRIAKIAAVGLIIMFSITISYVFTTPNMFRTIDGAPLMNKFPVTDFFILKDIMYLGFGITLLQYSNKK